jgi:DNA-binding response OmpR family regulator
MMTGDTILIVDADPETEEKIVSTLESEGYIVFASSGSKVNAEMAKKFRPALIFLKPLAPSAAGFEVCRTIHNIESLSGVPIVILASLKGSIDARYTDYYGIVDFLKLTFTPEELMKKTTTIIKDRQVEVNSVSNAQATPVEDEVRPEQEVAYIRDEADALEETGEPLGAREKNARGYFREDLHAATEEKAATEAQPAWDEKRYAAQQYNNVRSRKSSRKGLIIVAAAAVALIAAGLVLYQFSVEPLVYDERSSVEPQKQQAVTENKPDVPSPQPTSSPPAPVQAPEPAPLPPAKTFYAAQIGAFKTEDIAEALAQKLKGRGYEAFTHKGTAKDATVVYRVLIGRFEQRKEAVTLAGTVGAKEKIKTTIFQGQ